MRPRLYPSGVQPSRVGAFFDVDHTLLSVNTGFRWARYQQRIGAVSTRDLIRTFGWILRYRVAQVDHEALIARVAATYAGTSVAYAETEMRRWFEAEVLRFLRPIGRARVDEHVAAGHTVALLSSGTRYTLTPLADPLGIAHIICTAFEERDGLMTGLHERPSCAGEGKLVHAERFAAEHDVDLGASWFYTDSHADTSLLDAVGHAVAVNPDRRLRRIAGRKGWAIEDWSGS